MAKVIQQHDKCIGCGTCVAVCPAFWQMSDDGKAQLKSAKDWGEVVAQVMVLLLAEGQRGKILVRVVESDRVSKAVRCLSIEEFPKEALPVYSKKIIVS